MKVSGVYCGVQSGVGALCTIACDLSMVKTAKQNLEDENAAGNQLPDNNHWKHH